VPKALNDISTWQNVGLYWVPEHAVVERNEILEKLARDDFVQKFVNLTRPWGTVGRI
jgi:hypothetical protein